MNPTARRVERLLKLLFADIQQREAARQLDVTQSLLSRTLSGEREPSKTLLRKLGAFPGVNVRWLLDGIGEPLVAGGTTLPVIEQLPKKPGTKWEELEQEAKRFWISEARFSETRYWWRVNEKTLRAWGEWRSRCKFAPGDHLLLETDHRQIEALPGNTRLVVASHPELSSGKPMWGILDEKMHFTPLAAESGYVPQQPRPNKKRPRRKITRNPALRDRPGDQDFANHDQHLQAPQTTKPPHVVVELTHIMAVVIEMTSSSVLKE